MVYGISDFKSLIEEISSLTGTPEEKAKKACDEAFDLAGRWTDGRYSVPRESAFLEVFQELEVVRSYYWKSGDKSLKIMFFPESVTVDICGITGIGTLSVEEINDALRKGEEKQIVMALCFSVYERICNSPDVTKEFIREISCCLNTAKITGNPIDVYSLPEPVFVGVDMAKNEDLTGFTVIQDEKVKEVQLELF